MIPSVFFVRLDLTMTSLAKQHVKIVQRHKVAMKKVPKQKENATVSQYVFLHSFSYV